MAGDIFDQIHSEAQAPPPIAAAGNGDIFDQIHSETNPMPASPMEALSKTTGIGPGPGFFAQKWNEIKQGLTSSAPGAGLPPQPTALGNAAQFTGMMGQEAFNLGLFPGMAEGATAATEAIPSVERAGKTFQELKGAIGTHSVAMTDKLADALADVKDAVDTGSTLPSVVNKFVTRIADVDKGPLTYSEARQFYHNISDLSASEKMAAKASDLRLIQGFKHALGDTIAQTAENANRLDAYQKAMSEYANAMRLKEGLVKAGKIAVGASGLGGLYSGYQSIKNAMMAR
jgi:hypothetical protein